MLLISAVLLGDQASVCQAMREFAESALFNLPTQPTHVVRLHRYDHSGLEAMQAAEARWHGPAAHADGDGRGADGRTGFVQLSSRQIEWLRGHHAETLVQMGGDISSGLAAAVHRHETSLSHAKQAYVDGPTATRLSSLASQYVGPLSVGTVTSPSGCASSSPVALAYMPRISSTGEASSTIQTCHAEEQSEIWAVFDTGSTNLWVASDLCIKGPCTKKGRRRYNHSLSQTFVSPQKQDHLHVVFGTGSLSGPLSVDDFHVGPFTVYNQSFAMIQEQQGSVFEEVPFEGILGLAFPSMSANGVTPFFDSIIQQKALKSNAFAFYFSLNNAAANAIFWGGWDSKFHEGSIEYFKVSEEHYWSLALKSFQVGGKELLGDGSSAQRKGAQVMLEKPARSPTAIVDTGTTLFTAQGKTFQEILRRLPGVSCDKMTEESHPPILFRLENELGDLRDFELKNTQYMTADSAGNQCSAGFMDIELPAEHGPGMILGEIFLRHYFAVFDRGSGRPGEARVGFARAAHGQHVDEHLKELTKTQQPFGPTTM